MLETPQNDRNNAHKCHPPLLQREWFSCSADGSDLDLALAVRGSFRSVTHQQQKPDKEDRDGRDRYCNAEPLRPIRLRAHGVQSNKILWRRNGRALAANISREGDSQLRMTKSVRAHVPSAHLTTNNYAWRKGRVGR